MKIIQKIKQLFGFVNSTSEKSELYDPFDLLNKQQNNKLSEKRRDLSSGSPTTGSSSSIVSQQKPNPTIMHGPNYRY